MSADTCCRYHWDISVHRLSIIIPCFSVFLPLFFNFHFCGFHATAFCVFLCGCCFFMALSIAAFYSPSTLDTATSALALALVLSVFNICICCCLFCYFLHGLFSHLLFIDNPSDMFSLSYCDYFVLWPQQPPFTFSFTSKRKGAPY
jgi:hypothetical protein